MADRGIKAAPALARECGLNANTARSYVNGMRSPSLEACRKIGPGLGVSSDWLFYGVGPLEAEALPRGRTVEGQLAATQVELRFPRPPLFRKGHHPPTFQEKGPHGARRRLLPKFIVVMAHKMGVRRGPPKCLPRSPFSHVNFQYSFHAQWRSRTNR
jgi:transcriptional regulator with XRE-family HTH domain